jgi:hypothetical protein
VIAEYSREQERNSIDSDSRVNNVMIATEEDKVVSNGYNRFLEGLEKAFL